MLLVHLWKELLPYRLRSWQIPPKCYLVRRYWKYFQLSTFKYRSLHSGGSLTSDTIRRVISAIFRDATGKLDEDVKCAFADAVTHLSKFEDSRIKTDESINANLTSRWPRVWTWFESQPTLTYEVKALIALGHPKVVNFIEQLHRARLANYEWPLRISKFEDGYVDWDSNPPLPPKIKKGTPSLMPNASSRLINSA